MKCGICNEVWAAIVEDTVKGGEIRLCAKHWQDIKQAQHLALAALLEEVK
jgi:hypothetical protein